MLNPKMHLNPKLFEKTVERVPTRNGYGAGLLELGKRNPNVVVLTGDLKESTRVEAFAATYPERFIECGVAGLGYLFWRFRLHPPVHPGAGSAIESLVSGPATVPPPASPTVTPPPVPPTRNSGDLEEI